MFHGHLAYPSVAYSRPSLKKYLKANHKNLASSDTVFDTQFNKAIKSGVEKGDFAQPKGTSDWSFMRFPYKLAILHDLVYVCHRGS